MSTNPDGSEAAKSDGKRDRRFSRFVFLIFLLSLPCILFVLIRLVPALGEIPKTLRAGSTIHLSFKPWFTGLILAALQVVISSALAIPIGFALSKRTVHYGLYASIVGAPYFVPPSVFTVLIMNLAGTFDATVAMSPATTIFVVTCIDVARFTGLLAVVFCALLRDGKAPGRIFALAMLLRFSAILVSNIDVVVTLSGSVLHPLILPPSLSVYQTEALQFATSVTQWYVYSGLQLVILVFLYLAAIRVFKRLDHRKQREPGTFVRRASHVLLVLWSAFIVGCAVYWLAIPILRFRFTIERFRAISSRISLGMSMLKFLPVAVTTAIVGLYSIVAFAYPVVSGRGKGVRRYLVFLLTAASLSTGGIYGYRFFRSVGLLNTLYPYLVEGITPIVLTAVPLLWFLRHPMAHDNGPGEPYRFLSDYLQPSRRLFAGLALLLIIRAWNHIGAPGLILNRNIEAMSPVTLFHYIASQSEASDPGVLLLGAIVAAPSVALFFAARKFIADEALIGATILT